jgi:hypothetical protein
MKKITLTIAAFLGVFTINAQDSCEDATPVTVGTYTVTGITGTDIPDPRCALNGEGATGGAWYAYTASADGIATIETISNGDSGDTRMHVYAGDCSSLECYAGNDDIDPSQAVSNFFSLTTFPIENGETYFIAFDDRWDAGGFDFTITEDSSINCDQTLPFSEDWIGLTGTSFGTNCYNVLNLDQDNLQWTLNGVNDLNGDGNNDNVALLFPALPNPPSPGDDGQKDDWLISPKVQLESGTTYTISFTYNALDNQRPANESFDIALLNSRSNVSDAEILSSYSEITQAGTFGDPTFISEAYTNQTEFTVDSDDDYFIGFHATSPILSDILILIDYTIESELGVNSFDINNFNYFIEKNTSLQLSAENSFSNVKIYSILGQEVISKELNSNNERIDISSLNTGVYLAQVELEGQVKTFKFIKK